MKKIIMVMLTVLGVGCIGVLLLLLGPWFWGWLRGFGEFPDLAGPHPVGFARVRVTDVTREEIFTDTPDDVRDLMVSVYYPGATNAIGGPGRYGDRREIRMSAGIPAFLSAPLRPGRIHNAPAAEGRFPVLLFAPALEGPVLFYASLLEQVASHGYLVVAIDRPYTTAAVAFNDDRLISANDAGLGSLFVQDEKARLEAGDRISLAWAQDHTSVLDALLEGRGELAAFQSIVRSGAAGVFGHSFGGQAAATTFTMDGRFAAGLNMDGTIMYRPMLEHGVDQPIAFVYSDVTPPYEYLAERGETVTDWFSRWEERNRPPAIVQRSRDARTFQISGLAHEGFTTDFLLVRRILPLLISRDVVGTITAEELIPALSDLVVAWFDVHLRGDDPSILDDLPARHQVLHAGLDTSGWRLE